ncbi:MAG: PqqD family protein [Rhodocyclales bacterium]|nr:PqqD family protein [Rhodocyclales bacterium]
MASKSGKSASLRLRSRIRLEADADGEGGMLFDTQTAMICACNSSAWTVVSAMRKGNDADKLTGLITEAYDVNQTTARRDVLSLIKELRTLDILEPD